MTSVCGWHKGKFGAAASSKLDSCLRFPPAPPRAMYQFISEVIPSSFRNRCLVGLTIASFALQSWLVFTKPLIFAVTLPAAAPDQSLTSLPHAGCPCRKWRRSFISRLWVSMTVQHQPPFVKTFGSGNVASGGRGSWAGTCVAFGRLIEVEVQGLVAFWCILIVFLSCFFTLVAPHP